jgi:hypothetical protein
MESNSGIDGKAPEAANLALPGRVVSSWLYSDRSPVSKWLFGLLPFGILEVLIFKKIAYLLLVAKAITVRGFRVFDSENFSLTSLYRSF